MLGATVLGLIIWGIVVACSSSDDIPGWYQENVTWEHVLGDILHLVTTPSPKCFQITFSNSSSTNIPPEGVPPLPEAPSDPGWGDFAAWSQCSATCGAGQISRMRLCTPKIEENGFKNFTVCDGYPQERFIFIGNPPQRDFKCFFWMESCVGFK